MNYYIDTNAAGDFCWRLKAGNNEIIASGEGYKNKRDCEHAISLVKSSAFAPVTDITTASLGTLLSGMLKKPLFNKTLLS